MILHAIKDHNLANSLETKWIDLEPELPGKNHKAVSVQIRWEGGAGALDGEILIIGSNDKEASGYRNTIPVDKATNFQDENIIILRRVFRFLKIVYAPGGMAAGLLNGHVFFR